MAEQKCRDTGLSESLLSGDLDDVDLYDAVTDTHMCKLIFRLLVNHSNVSANAFADLNVVANVVHTNEIAVTVLVYGWCIVPDKIQKSRKMIVVIVVW